MGDQVKVKVLAVSLESRKIDLAVVGEPKHNVSGRAVKASRNAAFAEKEANTAGASRRSAKGAAKSSAKPAAKKADKPKAAKSAVKKPRRTAKKS